MNWRPVKVALLELAHLTWNLYNQIVTLLVLLYYTILSHLEQANRSHDQICLQHGGQLRVPKHMAVCFTNESSHLDLESIARLICWCKQLSVAYITLYDDVGRLKERQGKLMGHIELQLRALGYEKPISHVEGLTILSRADGRERFVEEVRKLVKLGPQDVTLEQVDNLAPGEFACCHPELLVSFGSPLCLYGFPPWQLRLTEILTISSHRKLPQKVFLDCLRRYSSTSQREGV